MKKENVDTVKIITTLFFFLMCNEILVPKPGEASIYYDVHFIAEVINTIFSIHLQAHCC